MAGLFARPNPVLWTCIFPGFDRGWTLQHEYHLCRFIRDDAVEAEAVRQAEAERDAERRRVAASIRGSLTKQV